jgi:hypothetical protein
MPPPRVVLVHWSDTELGARADRIAAAGYEVQSLAEMTPAVLKGLTTRPPQALVIDLSRLPSHGRRVGEVAREQRSLRSVPLVFVDGGKEKVAQVRHALPDAIYTSWRGIKGALSRAIARSPDPAMPVRAPAGYSGTPLPKKLGIRAHTTVALVGAPEGFETVLGALPDGVTVRHDLRRPAAMAIFFVRDGRAYEGVLPTLTSVLDSGGGGWIAWPKQASGIDSDLNENIIRDVALANGLVDIKVCAIDSTWSGLRIARRRVKA